MVVDLNGQATLAPIDGELFYIDKPLRWTSFDAVNRVRSELLRRTGLRKLKVGHAGTLDPLATGVMILCTGRATKMIDSLQTGVKEYVATIALGATTPSFDLETEIDARYPVSHITRELVEQTLQHFTGRIEQIPPEFSACKIDGVRAYDMARKGMEVKLKPKILIIDEIELLDYQQDSITVRVLCGKGTYIRALARDIGEALGSGAHLTALRRTRVGDIHITDCMELSRAIELIKNAYIRLPEPEQHKQ